jgi:hypothetical protein
MTLVAVATSVTEAETDARLLSPMTTMVELDAIRVLRLDTEC